MIQINYKFSTSIQFEMLVMICCHSNFRLELRPNCDSIIVTVRMGRIWRLKFESFSDIKKKIVNIIQSERWGGMGLIHSRCRCVRTLERGDIGMGEVGVRLAITCKVECVADSSCFWCTRDKLEKEIEIKARVSVSLAPTIIPSFLEGYPSECELDLKVRPDKLYEYYLIHKCTKQLGLYY